MSKEKLCACGMPMPKELADMQARIEKCEAMLWVAYRKSGSPKEYRDWRNLIKANI